VSYRKVEERQNDKHDYRDKNFRRRNSDDRVKRKEKYNRKKSQKESLRDGDWDNENLSH
jgi:hypothetical protein